jgi:leukotriene-A4 hydrolase
MSRRLLAALVLVLAACRQETTVPATPAAAPVAAPSISTAQPSAQDPHTYARPEEARVEHITLDLSVDFAKKQLHGTAALRLVRKPEAKTLLLDSNGLTIRRITLQPGDVETTYALGKADPILGSALEIPLRAETNGVTIEYASSPDAKALQWLDPAMTAGKKHPFLLSQSQAILARTWVPCQDSPGIRFTYDATLRVPKELLAVMSAENPTAKTADGVYRFSMKNPIPAYLLAIAVGEMEFRALDARSGVYAEPSVVAGAASEFRDIPKMMSAAEELYGPYRWGRYDVLVLPPSFPYGGMENPRLTFLTPTIIAGDRSLVALIAHELAHSWSGNLVTNATWSDFWLNEGFTTYFEHRITEKLYGREYSEMLWLLGVTEVKEELASLEEKDEPLFVDLKGRDPDEAPALVYEKGALFLRLMEETAGREAWDPFLRKYFDANAFKPMTTPLFLEILNRELPDVAKKVNVDAWIHGPGLPANAPKPQSQAFAKVEAHAKAFAAGGTTDSIPMKEWSSHETVHFIQSLPNLYPERFQTLDRAFRFSDSGNSEVLSAWFEKSLDTGYSEVYPAIERFLTTQGRRKFLRPLYEKLAKDASGLAFAKRVYAKARPTYHPVSQTTIDAILEKKPAS